MRKFLLAGAAAIVAGSAALAQTPPAAPVPPADQRVHMMVMSDHVMTRDEVVRHVRDLFAKLDANRDGYVTREELDAFHQKMMGMAGDMEKRMSEHGIMMGDRNAIFDKLDTNHDGSISRQEFMAGQQARQERIMIMRNGPEGTPGEPGMRMRMHEGMGMRGFGGHLFEMADANHDGRVSLAEAEAAALAHFDKADLNHDGKITPEERQQMHQQMRAQRRPS